MITRKLRFFYWVLSDGPSWAEMLCLSTGGMLNNLPLPTGPSWTLSCMVGFWHWHIPTVIITDIFPPWWDFVMVGICRQAMMTTMQWWWRQTNMREHARFYLWPKLPLRWGPPGQPSPILRDDGGFDDWWYFPGRFSPPQTSTGSGQDEQAWDFLPTHAASM